MHAGKPQKQAKLKPEYIAGLFDGEGCINFSRCRTSIFPRILLVNTNLAILEKLKAQYGGDIQKLSRKPNWKQAYIWRLSWLKAVNFLDEISDWLEIKTEQADIIFAWDFLRKELTPEAKNFLIKQLHWLNKRGPATEAEPLKEVLSAI